MQAWKAPVDYSLRMERHCGTVKLTPKHETDVRRIVALYSLMRLMRLMNRSERVRVRERERERDNRSERERVRERESERVKVRK